MKTLGMLLNEAFANDKQMKAAIYVMVCHAAGTVENPFAEYDVTLTF